MGEENNVSGPILSSMIRLLRHIQGTEPDSNETKPSITNKQFPWIAGFSQQCWTVAQQPTAGKLEALITELLKHLDRDINQCYTRPKRAKNLKQDVASFLDVCHWIYEQINKSLDHTMYPEKVSDVLAHYIDLELKSSRIGNEPERNVPRRLITYLTLLLDHSTEHMIDAVLKAKLVTKKYGELCAPIMGKLLEDTPREMLEESYIRYILAYKLWKRLAGKEDFSRINRLALERVIPPPGFTENLKSGFFSNILPFVSKSEKGRITFFLMQSPFSVKKKAQLFLRETRKIQTTSLIDQPIFNEDFQVTPFFGDDVVETTDLLSDIWETLNKDSNNIDDLLDNEEDESARESGYESHNHVFGEGLESGDTPAQLSLKRRKSTSVGSCVGIKKPNKNLIVDALITVGPSESAKLMMKTEDVVEKSSLCFEDKGKTSKPCATVEPACSSENRISELFSSVSIKSQKVDHDISEALDDMVIEGSTDTVDSSDVIIIDDDKPDEGEIVEQEVVVDNDPSNYIFIVDESVKGEISLTHVANNNQIRVDTDVLSQTINSSTPLSSPSNIPYAPSLKTSPTAGIPDQIFTSENIENNTTLDLRQDSFASNQSLMTNIFSVQFSADPNPDEGSDEEVPHRRHVVSSGKVSAFDAHMEEEAEEFDSNSHTSSQSLSGESSENLPSPSVMSQPVSHSLRPDLQPRVVIENIGQDMINQSNLNCRNNSGTVNPSLNDNVVTDQQFVVSQQPMWLLCIAQTLPPPQTASIVSALQGCKQCPCQHRSQVDEANKPRSDITYSKDTIQPKVNPQNQIEISEKNQPKINVINPNDLLEKMHIKVNEENQNDRIKSTEPEMSSEVQNDSADETIQVEINPVNQNEPMERIQPEINQNDRTETIQPTVNPENQRFRMETIQSKVNPESQKPISVLPLKKRKAFALLANNDSTSNEANGLSLGKKVSFCNSSTSVEHPSEIHSTTEENNNVELAPNNQKIATLKFVRQWTLGKSEETDDEQEPRRAKRRKRGRRRNRNVHSRACKDRVVSYTE